MQSRVLALLCLICALFAVTTSAMPAAYNALEKRSDLPVDVELPVELSEFDLKKRNDAEDAVSELVKRTSFPVNVDAKLKAKISAAIKANVKANILAKISASVSEEVKATLDIKVKALGGLISIGDAKLTVHEKAALKKLSANLEAAISAKLDIEVYANLDAEIEKLLGHKKTCSEKDLLKILVKLEASLIAKLKVKLPKICLGLKAQIQAAVDACIKDLEINIPLLLDVKVSASIKINVLIKACVDAAVKICADLSAKVCAQAVLQAL
ncbi:hypothetical protein BC940DRAFT_335612 [Gongronella butleri]|nr:hypothetical protein BC940DRAFT_335612 [Gongronella butleri]